MPSDEGHYGKRDWALVEVLEALRDVADCQGAPPGETNPPPRGCGECIDGLADGQNDPDAPVYCWCPAGVERKAKTE